MTDADEPFVPAFTPHESARLAAFFDSFPPIPNLLEGDPE